MKTVLRYYIEQPVFGPSSSNEEDASRMPKRSRESDLAWARVSYPWLSQFSDSEIKINLGTTYPIVIFTEHPFVEVCPEARSGIRIVADSRLDPSRVKVVELLIHEVEHPGTITGAREWKHPTDGRVLVRAYGEAQRPSNGFGGMVFVQSFVDTMAEREKDDDSKMLQRIMSALLYGRALALGILKPDSPDAASP